MTSESPKRGRRKIYQDERHSWLRSYEAGQASIPQLARKTGRNPRTISPQLQQAVEENERARARTELYRQALTQHNEGLLEVVGMLRDAIAFPSIEPLFLLARFPDEAGAYTPFRLQGVEMDVHFELLPFGTEDQTRLYELLHEHLPRERQLWSSLKTWFETLGALLLDAYRLGERTGDLATERAGMNLRAANKGGEGLNEAFLSWVCRLAFETRAGILAPYVLATTMAIAGRELRFGGSALAVSEERTALEKAWAVFDELVGDLGHFDEVIRMVNRRNALGDLISPLRRRLGDLLLSGFVPGRCSVCKVLGR